MQNTRAVLVREVPVQVVEFSLSGCRFTSDHALEEKMVGRLSVTLSGKGYQDTVLVVRTRGKGGAGPVSTMAGLFAWVNRLGTASIRSVVPVDIVHA